jgi:predicted phage baseplate assembly protein
MLRQEVPQTEFGKGDLRLRRDRNKRVTEVWVRWQGQKHFFFSGPNDRHYVLERSRGRLIFGDGEHGRVPPPGAAIMAKQYRTGGGLAGNVTAGSINQVLAGIGGVEAVFNPKAAEGGDDAETLAALASRGPQSLRHQGRALAPGDYETMAKEASPAVAVARAMATRDNNGRPRPGWVTLVIIPQSEAPRPWPSFGLREQVRRYIAGQAPADVVAADHMYITGPMYQEIDVAVTVVPLDSAEAGTVEQRVRQALANFFHPLRGGPEGRGWTPGRHVFLSDVASVLERVAGVDYVKELSLLLNGVLQRERARVADGRIPVAGEIHIRILAG